MWSECGCVKNVLPRPTIHEMRLAVAWAVLYSGIVECMCSVAMWVLWDGLQASNCQATPD